MTRQQRFLLNSASARRCVWLWERRGEQTQSPGTLSVGTFKGDEPSI